MKVDGQLRVQISNQKYGGDAEHRYCACEV